ncbi:hypothetical protein ABI59_21515 [Acidobacteria bacterium Mor1]|nr:hypothetical protein ABI59_21515 [Acidobacteria bacterium Mor1]
MSEEFEPFGGTRQGPGAQPTRREQLVTQWVTIAEVCVALIMGFALTFAAMLPLFGLLDIDFKDNVAVIAFLLPIQALIFSGLAWVLSRDRVPQDVLPAPRSPLFSIGFGVAVGGLGYVVETGALWLLEQVDFTSSEQPWVAGVFDDPSSWWKIFPLIVVVGPVAEELFFRAYAFRHLLTRVGAPVAYLLSSLLFALSHGNPSGIPAYTILALFLAWSYRRSGSLWTPVVAHVVHNAIVVITYLYLGVDG